MQANQIQVIEKAYKQADGSEIVAHLIRMGDQDYLTVAQAAEAFGVTPQAIRMAVMRNGLSVTNGDEQILDSLKQLGVIPLKTPTVNLLPRDTIDELVRIINTAEAKTAYRQIIGEWREAKQQALNPTGAQFEQLRAAAQTTLTMVTMVNTRVEEVASSLSERVAQDKDDNLTSAQAEQLVETMRQRAFRIRTNFKYLSVPQLINSMKSCVKNYFFDRGVAGAMQWKDIRQADLPTALEILDTWDPSQKHDWAYRNGASYRAKRKAS